MASDRHLAQQRVLGLARLDPFTRFENRLAHRIDRQTRRMLARAVSPEPVRDRVDPEAIVDQQSVFVDLAFAADVSQSEAARLHARTSVLTLRWTTLRPYTHRRQISP